VKIKIKNKSEGKNKFLIGGLNWKEKNNNKKKKNENQIKNKCTMNLDWMMKSKTINVFRKALRQKSDIKINRITLKKKLYIKN